MLDVHTIPVVDWDQRVAEDLVADFCSGLARSSRRGTPGDPDGLEEANRLIVDALVEQDPALLERGLRNARDAWERPPELYLDLTSGEEDEHLL